MILKDGIELTLMKLRTRVNDRLNDLLQGKIATLSHPPLQASAKVV
ncbi:hypothetical protein APX70_02937 [Pseudomonas syringae pv. maculicola]|uniref:Uncharacterized protein n=1 Tax=Pseudomonas syringae pv. maculicola TaxID=59511 RepID=A0A3M2XDX5_PSEYM|nr:hypothetical protein APX70_02937 [Pseudomonas syringae pv. maculicola]